MFNKKLKIIISCILLSSCMMSTNAFAGTWKEQIPGFADYWEYIKDDGGLARDEWIYDNGSWYFINHGGNMARGIANTVGGSYYCFESSGKLATGGFVDKYSYDGKRKISEMYFADKDGHPVGGLFMVDGVLYNADAYSIDTYYAEPSILYQSSTTTKTPIKIDCFNDHGKVLDKDGKPFASNSKFYTNVKYLPKYDSKGNLIGEIKNENGHPFYLISNAVGTPPA